jgi:hypothetical protein
MILPYVLIVLGMIFLLNNAGILAPLELQLYWPVILVIIGFAMLAKKRERGQHPESK